MENISTEPQVIAPSPDQVEDHDEEIIRKTTRNIPQKDSDVRDAIFEILEEWKKNPLPLVWTDPAKLEVIANNYDTALKERLASDDDKSPTAGKLDGLDDKIDDSLSYVKGYIADKYLKENAERYYGQFGIKKVNDYYRLPDDRNDRKTALSSLVNALDKHGFGAKKFGAAFWTPIRDEYVTLLKQIVDVEQGIAEPVHIKNQLKEQIIEHLKAIVHLLKANYPESFEMQLRKWGFNKTRY